jgi:hypothetical protein
MEDYYEQRGGSVGLDSPPSYDAFLLQPTNSRKYNIQPREDEGKEILPPYSCAISLESVFMRKLELEGAVHRAQDRNWYKVFATLQGTALSFHKYKGSGPFALPRDGNSSPDMPAGAKRGCLMKSYNLQHADVGIAADYYKYVFSPTLFCSGCGVETCLTCKAEPPLRNLRRDPSERPRLQSAAAHRPHDEFTDHE